MNNNDKNHKRVNSVFLRAQRHGSGNDNQTQFVRNQSISGHKCG